MLWIRCHCDWTIAIVLVEFSFHWSVHSQFQLFNSLRPSPGHAFYYSAAFSYYSMPSGLFLMLMSLWNPLKYYMRPWTAISSTYIVLIVWIFAVKCDLMSVLCCVYYSHFPLCLRALALSLSLPRSLARSGFCLHFISSLFVHFDSVPFYLALCLILIAFHTQHIFMRSLALFLYLYNIFFLFFVLYLNAKYTDICNSVVILASWCCCCERSFIFSFSLALTIIAL